jgi:hypothetical protein
MSKNTKKEEKKEEKKEKEEKKKKEKDIKKYEYIFTSFVELFNKNGKHTTCKIKFSDDISDLINGYYIYNGNIIEINESKLCEKEIKLFLKNIDGFIENIANIKLDIFYNTWFGISNPESIVPHELEHARRMKSHDMTGAHDDIIYKNEKLTFSQSTNKVLTEVMENSLIIDWLKNIKKNYS